MAARDELEQLRRLNELETRASARTAAPADKRGAISRFGQGIADRADANVRKIVNLEHGLLRKGAGLLGMELDELEDKSLFSDKSIGEVEKKAAATPASSAGGVVADLAITAPLGAVGRGMEALAATRGAPRVLSRTLAARPVQAATEGALGGALLAEPEQRGEAAKMGAVYGVGAERVGAGIGRMGDGLVKRSPDAQALDQVADLHGSEVRLPLSQAASDEGVASPVMKFIYGKVLPNLPGAEGALQRQAQRAGSQFREIAMKEAAPGGMGSTQAGYSGGLPLTSGKRAGAGADVRQSMGDIQDAFEKEYKDTVKSYAFNQPDVTGLATRLQQKFPNIDSTTLNSVVQQFDDLVTRYSQNGVLDGDNLIRIKTRLAHMGREAGDERVGQSLYQAQEYLDDVVRQELRQGNNPQNLADLQRYEDLAEPWRNFQRVQRAAARSKDAAGQFTPQELNRAVKSMSRDRELARGTAPMQELAGVGERTVGQKLHNPSYLERALTMGTLGGAGLIGGPAALAGLWAGGRAAASPAVQDVLMGTNNTQRALMQALRRNPNKTRMAGATVRNTLAAEAADDEQE